MIVYCQTANISSSLSPHRNCIQPREIHRPTSVVKQRHGRLRLLEQHLALLIAHIFHLPQLFLHPHTKPYDAWRQKRTPSSVLRQREMTSWEIGARYLCGVAAVDSAGEGGDGVAHLAPFEEAEAAGGRRERGGGGEGADAEVE